MLKLERLELSGFKSFVDPVTLNFAGGITAIVGPNGCGKSNISDGMTWVLGEQSAKSLRGGRMEDIIFNGSDARRPLGLAEATLTLRTDPSFPRSMEGRITIGRRVFRSGEGQYKLNGKTVRLKEIKDLLMDTGLGIRAYSVIEQGKIGMILSGKPQERRKLLEEAAGITRYKARKRVAEVKLEEATANLLRLDDIIAEVERALRSLKRQAGAARRFKEKQEEYRQLLHRVLLGRWSLLHGRMAEQQQRLTVAVADEAELAAALHRDEAALAAGREALERQSSVLAEAHQRRSDLAATIQGRQEFLKSSRQTLEEIGERVLSGRTLAERRQADSDGNRQRLVELQERRDELLAERDQAANAVEEDERALHAADQDLKGAEARVAGIRQESFATTAALSGLRTRLHQGEIEQERGNSRRHHLEEELATAAFEVEQIGETVATTRDQVRELDTAQTATRTELERTAAALEETLAQEVAAGDHRRSVADELTDRRQRAKLLQQLSAAHEERRVSLESALAASGLDSPRYLAGEIAAVEGWEQALDFYLGALTDAVILPIEEASVTLARHLAGKLQKSGGTTLLRPADSTDGPAPPTVETLDDDAVVLSLGQALNLPDGLARALPPAFLVESAADAERLARQHPGLDFLSRDGIWAAGGALHVQGDEAMPGVLERQREMEKLNRAIPKLETQLQAADTAIEELVARRAEQARAKNEQEQRLNQVRQDLAVAQARLQDAQGRYERKAQGQAQLTEQQEKLATQLATMAERITVLRAELTQTEERERSLKEGVERATAEVDAAKGHRESLRAASAGRRGRLEVLQERLDSVQGEADRIAGEIAEEERQAALWRDESTRLERRRTDLTTQRETAEQELKAALENQDVADEQVIVEQERLDDLRSDIRALEERITDWRDRRDTVRSTIESLRVDGATLEGHAEHLAEQFREAFEADLPQEPEAAPAEMPELEADMARTKAMLERFGPVNVLAVEEYAEQEERYAFLTTQRTDVADSVASLKRTIREINDESSERFLATFVEVNKAFGEVFTRLFRGGEADMRLLDEEDPLESGIDIMARPPGKRLQNIMLMSGGEKALTAIALLFALFRTKPSPLCILDEVDAPLDDANTIRFVEMLQEMATDTQFLIITHNKISMEAASTLYGVTMEERGVSKLVSVEMDELQPAMEQRATA
jgi:chromosome segregation protein